MNIFDHHLKEIQNLILINKKKLKLENIDNLKNVNLEIPPNQFNFDLSCNIAMVLGKSNKLNPGSACGAGDKSGPFPLKYRELLPNRGIKINKSVDFCIFRSHSQMRKLNKLSLLNKLNKLN